MVRTEQEMNQPVTLEQALQINLQRYAELPAKERERTRIWVKEAANGSPYPETREFNAALLPLLFEVESRLKRAEMPPLPTPAETNAFLIWGFGLLAKIGAGVLVIGGGLWLVGSLIYGTGTAFIAGAVANSGVVFWAIVGAAGLVVAVAGYRNWPKNKEENKAGETPVQNQNIIVNVFTSQNGSVNVNSNNEPT